MAALQREQLAVWQERQEVTRVLVIAQEVCHSL